MKVLMTADPIGGVWSYALELSAGLGVYGVKVLLATLGAPLTRSQRVAASALPNVELHESEFRLEWMPDPWADLEKAAAWLLGLERKHRPDLVHLNHLVHGDLPWRAPALVAGHSCVLSWWAAVRRGPIPPDWFPYKDRVTRSLQAARCVVAPTRAMLIELQRYYGPLRNCTVIHNGRDSEGYDAAASRKEPLILCAGRLWDQAKNVEALAAVARKVRWPICVAGSDAAPSGGSATLTGLRALGALEPRALADWYARATIYALPARYEPFGLTALEAALCGCALVLGDIPSLREVWGDAALYVAPEDHEALRETLNGLIRDPSLRGEFASRALARARELSPARFVSGYRTTYRKLTELSPYRAGARSPLSNAPGLRSSPVHPT